MFDLKELFVNALAGHAIGLLGIPGVIGVDDVKNMAKDPIVFAMANPTPEIMPEEVAGLVAVMATGRSDYPNQINNVLCFPGIFRGALQCRASRINEEMKLAAANAIAGIITPEELHPKLVLERPDMRGHNRLSDIKRLRRTCDAFQPSHGAEHLELVEREFRTDEPHGAPSILQWL